MELIPAIFMGLFVGGTGLVGLVNSLNWIKRDCRQQLNVHFIINLFAVVSGAAAVGIFFTLLVMGFLENILLLSVFGFDTALTGKIDGEFTVWLIVAFSLKAVHIVWLTYLQCVIDIYIIDQEEGRSLQYFKPNQTDNSSVFTGCIWRTYFVANALVRLQSARRLPPVIVFTCGYLFLSLVPGLPSINNPQIVFHPANVSSAAALPPHTGPYYFFTVSSLTLMVAACLVYIAVTVRDRFFGNQIGELVDVCSWLNCSIFLRTHRYFAYYIHGRSVHSTAEFGFRQLVDMVHNEETNLVSRRGFQTDTDPQTFSFSLPDTFPVHFERILDETQSSIKVSGSNANPEEEKEQKNNGPASAITASTNIPFAVPREPVLHDGVGSASVRRLKQRAHTHDHVNRFLRDFLDHKYKEADYVVQWRNVVEGFFDIELGQVRQRGIMHYDPKGTFTDYFYIGRTFDLLIFEVLLFCLVAVYTVNYSFGLITVLLISYMMSGVRQLFGKVNLSKKAFIYGRFLI